MNSPTRAHPSKKALSSLLSGSAISKKPALDEATLRTMGALVRMPPKAQSEMKIGKRGRRVKSAAKPKAPAAPYSLTPRAFYGAAKASRADRKSFQPVVLGID